MSVTNQPAIESFIGLVTGDMCCLACLCCACTQAVAGTSTERRL